MKNHNRLFLLQPDESAGTAEVVAMINKVIELKDQILEVADTKATVLGEILEEAGKSRVESHTAAFSNSTEATKDEAAAREEEKEKIGSDFTKFIADTTGTPDDNIDQNTLSAFGKLMNENYNNHREANDADASGITEELKSFTELLGDVSGTTFPTFPSEV